MATDSDLPQPFFGDILPVQYPRGSNGQGHGQGHGHGNGQYGQGNGHGPGPLFHEGNNGPMGHGMMNDMPPYGHGNGQHGQGNFQGNMGGPNQDGGQFGRAGPGAMGGNMDSQRGNRGYGGQGQGGFGGPGQGGDPLIDFDVQVGDGTCVMM